MEILGGSVSWSIKNFERKNQILPIYQYQGLNLIKKNIFLSTYPVPIKMIISQLRINIKSVRAAPNFHLSINGVGGVGFIH